MATPVKNSDRRAERTRQMLRRAFLEVVREKGLTKVTVQDIVDQANVSRGTFYAHYSDKYALIEIIIREAFQRSIKKQSLGDNWNRPALQRLIKAVLEYAKTIQHHWRSREVGPVIDQAIREELVTIVLHWLKPLPPSSHLSADTIAQIISWTIFGAAVQWSREASALSADQMADEVMRLLTDGLNQVLPDGSVP